MHPTSYGRRPRGDDVTLTQREYDETVELTVDFGADAHASVDVVGNTTIVVADDEAVRVRGARRGDGGHDERRHVDHPVRAIGAENSGREAHHCFTARVRPRQRRVPPAAV